MSDVKGRPTIWTRMVADERFRVALIDDPLRALADVPDVSVSSEQVRRLEEMTRAEREELITGLFREAHLRGGQARFGTIGMDGRLGAELGDGGIAPA